MAHSSFTSFIRQRPGLASAAAIVLATGIFSVLRAPQTGLAPTGSVMVDRQENGSGSQVWVRYDNNDERGSGSLVKQGNISGSTVAVGTAGDRKNKIACYGTGGRLGYCAIDNGADDCGCLVP